LWNWETAEWGVLKSMPLGVFSFSHLQQFDFQSNLLLALVVHVGAQLDALAAHVGRALELRSQGNRAPLAAEAASRLFVLANHWFLQFVIFKKN
jgi:hypothetical protein